MTCGVLLGASLSGCFSVSLEPVRHLPEVHRLLAIPTRELRLEIEVPQSTQLVGYQYLLVIVPVTRVYVPHLEREVGTQLAVAAARRGVRLRPATHDVSATPKPPPTLRVVVEEVTLSGYDLFFVRRPWGAVTMSGTVELPDGGRRRCQVTHEHGSTERFAFAEQLSRTLAETLEGASEALFNCLEGGG